MSSIIYNLNGNDKTLILDTRYSLLQQFKAVNWADLRLSLMISITEQSDPNDPTGLFESFGAGADADNCYLGFKTGDSNLPAHTNFFGDPRLQPEFLFRIAGALTSWLTTQTVVFIFLSQMELPK
jgi:hypothetical protein